MRFAHPELLWFLLLLPGIGFFMWLRYRAGRRALEQALSPIMARRLTLHLSGAARGRRLMLVLLALALTILGGARPQRGTQYVTATRTGGDVIFALDVSESMLAEDLKPNRLQRARHEISAILDRLKGDRVGLVAFAGESFLQCPLTLDYSAARMFLEYMTPELIPQPGTDLGRALEVAVGAFDEGSEGYRALVLITDGEDHGGRVDEGIKSARDAGVKIFAVGIGNEAGEPIPMRGAAGGIQGYKQDRDGRVVLTRLEEGPLRRVAEETDGFYTRAGGTLGLHRVVDAIEGMEKRELEGGMRVLYEERYRYFVWPALILLLLEMWIPRRRQAFPVRPSFLRRALSMLAFALVVLPAQAGPSTAAPQGAVDAGRWRERFEENEIFRTEHPADARPLYNLGTLWHEQGDWSAAEQWLRNASPAAAGDLAGRIHYNLGSTLFRKGDLEAARDAFVEALRVDPQNEDAKRNLELTQRMLDRQAQKPDSLRQQQQENQEQKKQQDQQNEKGQQQETQTQGEENPQQQEQQDRQEQQEQQDQQNQQDQRKQQQQPDATEEQPENGDDAAKEQESHDAQDERSADPRETAEGDSLSPLEAQQVLQVLRGLEGRERELLKQRFRARSRSLRVEKDW
ncbi:MAG: VWA domain-containing protein [Candidatus Eisenbacteria bacterium]